MVSRFQLIGCGVDYNLLFLPQTGGLRQAALLGYCLSLFCCERLSSGLAAY